MSANATRRARNLPNAHLPEHRYRNGAKDTTADKARGSFQINPSPTLRVAQREPNLVSPAIIPWVVGEVGLWASP
jgi:hypothetical protein